MSSLSSQLKCYKKALMTSSSINRAPYNIHCLLSKISKHYLLSDTKSTNNVVRNGLDNAQLLKRRYLAKLSKQKQTVKHKTQRMSAILKIRSEIESRKCFAIKTTIFHHIANNFNNHTPLVMNNCTKTSFLMSNMYRSFYKLH